MQHIGIEVGDLLRPRRAGMARYAHCLVDGLKAQTHPAQFYGWAPWRRLLGKLINPADIKVRFFGKTPPQVRPDIFHATACVFPPWKSPIEIATVHDLYALPAATEKTGPEIAGRVEYIERADRIICVSQFTRNHLHELFEISPSRTTAIPLAAASHFVPATFEDRRKIRKKFRLPQEFFLFVGRDRPNKNLQRLVMAYAHGEFKIPLYIAGRHDAPSKERLAQLAKRNGCKGSLLWLDKISDAELPILLSCASALCMPSTFEGFGLPVIEAMACGTPVLTSAGCATEEAAGGYATLIEPNSIDSIAAGLSLVLETSEPQRAAARSYATRRTWSDVAAETFQVYVDATREKELPSANMTFN